MRPRTIAVITVWLLLAPGPGPECGVSPGSLEPAAAERFARLALDCVQREYPNKIAHVMQGDEDALPPRQLTPAFFGCFDWHSAVHGHWLLARLARAYPEAPFARPAVDALERSLTPENMAAEAAYLDGEGRATFERPYGLAWLLQLAAELRDWPEPRPQAWSEALRPLEERAAARLRDWLPKLSHPIREGEHDQTAFAFGLMLDWAGVAGDSAVRELLEERIRTLYLNDRDCPLGYEPSGQDFLSPCLAEADLIRRVLAPPAFAAWLGAFLPGIPLDGSAGWIEPAVVTDRADGKLAHLDGLNLSRAWMLEGILAGLPADDPRRQSVGRAAELHRAAGLAAVTGEYYEGGHWLGSFAAYLTTGRGLPAERAPSGDRGGARPAGKREVPAENPE